MSKRTMCTGQAIAILLGVILYWSPAQAQEPSLREAVEFLSRKVEQCGVMIYTAKDELSGEPFGVMAWSDVRLGELSRIAVTYYTHYQYMPPSHWAKNQNLEATFEAHNKYEVDLSDLSTEIKSESFFEKKMVTVACARKNCIDAQINLETRNYLIYKEEGKIQSKKRVSELVIYVCNEDANRVVNALRHAIKSSGGKEPKF